MTFSVIIPVFNRTDTLKSAIESVLCQTFREFEIIVVDDASDQSVRECLKPYLPMIKYIRLDKNRGVSSARNAGIRAASGEYVAFLDSDDLWLPDKLSTQNEALKSSKMLISHTNEFWFRDDKFVNQGKKHKRHGGDIFPKILDFCRISPSSVVIHKSVFKSAGMFDERMRVCEDYDLWLRISSLFPINYVDRKLIVKRAVTDDQLSDSIDFIESIRLVSLARFLRCRVIKPSQKRSAVAEIKRKSSIVSNGVRNSL